MHDPYVKKYNTDLAKSLEKADVVVIATNHDEYNKLNKKFLKKYVSTSCVICDIWNVTKENKIIYPI